MENGKKNTIVLTIIAIATLVVAVVGATFAYYSVETRNNTTTTTFTGTNNPIGAITLTSPVTTLQMTITPTDMARFTDSKKYYAIKPGDTSQNPNTSVGFYGTSRKNHEIAVATLVGGNTETAYTCTATLTVTTSGTMAALLQAGDAYLYLDGEQTTISTSATQKLDLSTIPNKSQTYSIIYKVNGTNNENRVAHITADIELNNNNAKDQSYLAGAVATNLTRPGTTLTVQIASSAFNCTIDTAKAS